MTEQKVSSVNCVICGDPITETGTAVSNGPCHIGCYHRVATSTRTLSQAINDIIVSQEKALDAPASSDSHLQRALDTLLDLCPEWEPWDDESREVAQIARDYMKPYKRRMEKQKQRNAQCGSSKEKAKTIRRNTSIAVTNGQVKLARP